MLREDERFAPSAHQFAGPLETFPAADIAAGVELSSLGAPFWFNMLKTLSNLRLILANKEEKKVKAKEKSWMQADFYRFNHDYSKIIRKEIIP